MQKSIRFFIRMLPVFFARVKPASHREKPACMKNTRAAPTSTQIVLTALNVILINSFRKICVCKTAEPPVAQVEQKRRLGKTPGAFALLYETQKALRKPCPRSAIA